MSQPISAIIFDLGGVILNLNYNLTIEAFQNLGKENFDQLYTQSHQDKIFDLFETGKISSPEFRNYFRKFLGEHISDQQIDDAWNAMLLDLPARRIDLIRQIKKKMPVYLFSNTNEIHHTAFRQTIKTHFGNENLLDDLFDQAYYSHIVGRRKPNADAFLKVIDDHKLTIDSTLFIDDSIQHIEGARQLGLQTIHLVSEDICNLKELKF
ncbi:MAG: HAD family phosphatase [Crocinitomicaceae bacterium]|nr:HAD family phosphatase [Crocinitomicaceae bacterium]MBK8927406.1 HAD family phosphatase [Crocinitomicaceae bacterium]